MQKSRKYRLRRTIAFLVLIAMSSLFGLIVNSCVAASQIKTVKQATLSNELPHLATLPLSSRVNPPSGVVAMSVASLGTVFTDSPQKQHPIASITKTITALVVLEKMPLTSAQDSGPMIEMSDVDAQILSETSSIGALTFPLPTSKKISERNALIVMMLGSAGNYATSMAIHAYGSLESFLNAANLWLGRQGLTSTVVSDASGLNPGSKSTTSDLLKLAEIAMSNSTIQSIVALPQYDVPAVGLVTNGNPLLGVLGVDGVKSGSTYEADECLLYSSTVTIGEDNYRIYGVSLGVATFEELVASATTALKVVQSEAKVIKAWNSNQRVGLITLAEGKSYPVNAKDDTSIVQLPGVEVSVSIDVEPNSPVTPGAKIGILRISAGTQTATTPVVVGDEIR